ncbi:MAG: Rrf2 family transcriptional regulator [Elusimicrobia bacterium]|nr:Rrf2 family transcriptional regulator [Elusimicrobiota bacterium]
MFTLTTKSGYGVDAVLDLARRYGDGLVQIKEIAERHGIPAPYLVQLFNRLTHAGLVRAFRGQQGGYALARNPRETSFLDVMEALEGPMEMTKGRAEEDVVKDIYSRAEVAAREALDVPLSEILARQDQKTGALFFQI